MNAKPRKKKGVNPYKSQSGSPMLKPVAIVAASIAICAAGIILGRTVFSNSLSKEDAAKAFHLSQMGMQGVTYQKFDEYLFEVALPEDAKPLKGFDIPEGSYVYGEVLESSGVPQLCYGITTNPSTPEVIPEMDNSDPQILFDWLEITFKRTLSNIYDRGEIGSIYDVTSVESSSGDNYFLVEGDLSMYPPEGEEGSKIPAKLTAYMYGFKGDPVMIWAVNVSGTQEEYNELCNIIFDATESTIAVVKQ